MRMLVDEKAGEKTWNLPGGEQNIAPANTGNKRSRELRIIYFILKSLDFFIEENVVSLFHWALFVLNFDFVSKICQYH